MKMGLVSRKKVSEAKNEDASTVAIPSGTSSNEEEKPTSSSYIVDIVCAVTLLALLYTLLFSPGEMRAHKKAVDLQLVQLGQQFSAQKTYLSRQLEALMTTQSQLQEQLKEEQVIEGAPAAAAAAAAAAAQLAETTATQVQRVQEEIVVTKAKVAKLDEKVANFCDTCSFQHIGSTFNCAARRDFLARKYSLTNEEAIAAVLSGSDGPSCAKQGTLN